MFLALFPQQLVQFPIVRVHYVVLTYTEKINKQNTTAMGTSKTKYGHDVIVVQKTQMTINILMHSHFMLSCGRFITRLQYGF